MTEFRGATGRVTLSWFFKSGIKRCDLTGVLEVNVISVYGRWERAFPLVRLKIGRLDECLSRRL